MTEITPRLSLPLLVAGQAQKELFHNEALVLLDLACQAGVRAVGLDTPPTDAAPGDCWVVGASPSGAWEGQAGALAGYTPGGWRFVAPREGMAVWDQARGVGVRRSGGAWHADLNADRLVVGGIPVIGAQRPPIARPTGGTTIDAEARAAVSAILAAMVAHGLIAP